MPEVRQTLKGSNSTYITMSGRVLGNFILAFDLTFFVYFTIDILLRFIVSPIKLKWIKNVMNIVDLTSIVLFWLFFFIHTNIHEHTIITLNIE